MSGQINVSMDSFSTNQMSSSSETDNLICSFYILDGI